MKRIISKRSRARNTATGVSGSCTARWWSISRGRRETRAGWRKPCCAPCCRTEASRREGRAVEVYMLPEAVLPLPDAGFLYAGGKGRAGGIKLLVEADESDHRHVAHDSHPWGAHGRIVIPLDAAQVEVEAVKRHALDQLAQRFRLEGSQGGVAEFLVRCPVGGGDAVEQTLVQLQQLC